MILELIIICKPLLQHYRHNARTATTLCFVVQITLAKQVTSKGVECTADFFNLLAKLAGDY